ncbi:unnamed protein product [Closterium sp. Naga37s-1]|nr:unnamed protein product [Closterium sp. Naga37s-1]
MDDRGKFIFISPDEMKAVASYIRASGRWRISGVMDDRGKFIFISPEEMKAIASYIRASGRVSIADLAARSNELIDLDAKAEEENGAVGDAGGGGGEGGISWEDIAVEEAIGAEGGGGGLEMGRVSIADLAARSNELIDLDAKGEEENTVGGDGGGDGNAGGGISWEDIAVEESVGLEGAGSGGVEVGQEQMAVGAA